MKAETTIQIGTTVEFAGQTALVIASKSGWLTLEIEGQEPIKARPSKCAPVLADPPAAFDVTEFFESIKNDEPATEDDENENDENEDDEPKAHEPASVENTDQIELTCPNCEHSWTPKRLKLSIQCPKCGTWVKVRLRPQLERYFRGLGTTASGNDTVDIGDSTADLLRGLSVEDLLQEAGHRIFEYGQKAMGKTFTKAYGIRPWASASISEFLVERYRDRNPGMVRMNVGNLLRAAGKRAESQA